MKAKTATKYIRLLASLFLLASLPSTSDAGWKAGASSATIAGITSDGTGITKIVMADEGVIVTASETEGLLWDDTNEYIYVYANSAKDAFSWISAATPNAVEMRINRFSANDTFQGASATAAPFNNGLTVAASKDLTLNDNARIMLGASTDGLMVDESAARLNFVAANSELTDNGIDLDGYFFQAYNVYANTAANTAGTGAPSFSQGLTVATAKTLAVETITPLSGGNITIKEHADDGGSDFLQGTVNGALVVNSPGGNSVQVQVGGAVKTAVYNGYTNLFSNYLVFTERADPGTPGANKFYLFADSSSGAMELDSDTTDNITSGFPAGP